VRMTVPIGEIAGDGGNVSQLPLALVPDAWRTSEGASEG